MSQKSSAHGRQKNSPPPVFQQLEPRMLMAADGMAECVLPEQPQGMMAVDANAVAGVNPVRIQAESFALSGAFVIDSAATADGGAVARLDFQGGSGVATTLLPVGGATGIAAGLNDLTVVVFDETDGESTIELELIRLDGSVASVGTAVFDQSGGGGGAQAVNLRQIVFSDVAVEAGDTLRITAQADAGEPARIDFVEFVSTDPTTSRPRRALSSTCSTIRPISLAACPGPPASR